MEDLINKKEIDKLCLEIYTEDPFCSITGICFIQDEDTYFGIEQRVEQLDKIIDVILLRLNEIEDSNKENIIKIIHEKKNQLNEIMIEIQKILSAKFTEFRDEYVNLKNSVCKINNYILKIKNLFNIII